MRKKQSKPAPLSAGDSPYWNIRFTTGEWTLLGLAALMCAALHLSPILNSSLAKPLTVVLAAVSYLSPVSGFFFIAANQYLPYPEGDPFNPAQIGVVVWLPVVLIRYRRLALAGAKHLWVLLPFLGWYTIMSKEFTLWLPESEYAKSVAYALIACQLAGEAKGQYLKCLFGLACGAFMVTTAYWGTQLGLPIQISDWDGAREGFERMGSVRADAVMVWPAVLIGVSGFLGIAAGFATYYARTTPPRWLLPIAVGALLLSLPPIAATMTHGAYAGLAIVLVAFVLILFFGKARQGANLQFASRLISLSLLAVCIAGAAYLADAFSIRSRAHALTENFEAQSEDLGAMASRTGVWHDSLDTISRFPLTGYIYAGGQEHITSEYASKGSYLSHNVFLDYGRSSGIPGMLLLAWFFFYPAVRMLRRPDWASYIPFLLTFVAVLIFWMCLSFQFYKTVWGLWMLMAIAAPALDPGSKPLPAGGRNVVSQTDPSASLQLMSPTRLVRKSKWKRADARSLPAAPFSVTAVDAGGKKAEEKRRMADNR